MSDPIHSDQGVDQGVGGGNPAEASYVHVEQVHTKEESSDSPGWHRDRDRNQVQLGGRVGENHREDEASQDGIVAGVWTHEALEGLLQEKEH